MLQSYKDNQFITIIFLVFNILPVILWHSEESDPKSIAGCAFVQRVVRRSSVQKSDDSSESEKCNFHKLDVFYNGNLSIGLESSEDKNVVFKLNETFGDCDVKNGLFRITPVRSGCNLKFCNEANETASGDGVGNSIIKRINCISDKDFDQDENNFYFENDSCKLPDLEEFPYGTCSCTNEAKFDKKWTGVIYSAYDKYPIPCEGKRNQFCHTSWINYSESEFYKQMELISLEFQQVSFYGMGTDSGRLHWNQSNIKSSSIPLYLSQFNKRSGFLRLEGVVGIFRLNNFDLNWVKQETENAINITLEANKVFAKSIWGISIQLDLSSEDEKYLKDEMQKVIGILKQVKSKVREPPVGQSKSNKLEIQIKVGLRIPDCHKIIIDDSKGLRPEQNERPFCSSNDIFCPDPFINGSFIEVLEQADFIICHIKPWMDSSSNLNGNYSIKKEVNKVGTWFLRIEAALRKINKNSQTIGETGWASQGKSISGSPNTLTNLKNYWEEMSKWSKSKEFQLYMFEAFDEPWKNNLNATDKSHQGKDCGSEAFYGWWKRANNSNPPIYIEKQTELNLQLSDGLVEKIELSPECRINIIESQDKLNQSDQKHLLSQILIASLIVLGAFIVIVSYMGHRLRRAKKSEAILSRRYLEIFLNGTKSEEGKVDELIDDNYNIVALRFPYDRKKYELQKNQFTIDTSTIIGVGQGGTVYKGLINDLNKPVAFKTTDTMSSILAVKNLLSEIKIMSYIGEHENIVCLLGASTDKLEKGIVYVALEYCGLGSLDKYFFKHRSQFRSSFPQLQIPLVSKLNYVAASFLTEPSVMESPTGSSNSEEDLSDLNDQLLVRWAFETANGMEFLESRKVVHADLATRNLLLTDAKSIKITDFGLSRKLYHEIGETFDPEMPLPWRWMSPESLRSLTFSTETDIWSYGVTIWEFFSLGDVPYPGVNFSNKFLADIENGTRLQMPKLSTIDIYNLMTKCWKLNPSERPSFTQLKAEFQRISNENKNSNGESIQSQNISQSLTDIRSKNTNEQFIPFRNNKSFTSYEYMNAGYLKDNYNFK